MARLLELRLLKGDGGCGEGLLESAESVLIQESEEKDEVAEEALEALDEVEPVEASEEVDCKAEVLNDTNAY